MIAPTLRAALAALEGPQVAAVLARNVIAAARLVTLRVHAPRRPEADQEEEEEEEATAVAGEAGEATVVSEVAVKKHGALPCVVSCRPSGTDTFFFKLHLRWSRPSIS